MPHLPSSHMQGSFLRMLPGLLTRPVSLTCRGHREPCAEPARQRGRVRGPGRCAKRNRGTEEGPNGSSQGDLTPMPSFSFPVRFSPPLNLAGDHHFLLNFLNPFHYLPEGLSISTGSVVLWPKHGPLLKQKQQKNHLIVIPSALFPRLDPRNQASKAQRARRNITRRESFPCAHCRSSAFTFRLTQPFNPPYSLLACSSL